MMKLLKKYWQLPAIFLASFLVFYKSLFGFFTNDDFFFLKIAKVSSVGEFLNFFNPMKDYGGIGVYRPIPLRFIYFLDVKFFNQSPLFLHIVAFATFFIVIFLVYKLISLLTKNNKIAMFSSFLYAVSVTHFGQLYYINQYQELCVTLFFLASVILFIKYEIGVKAKRPLNVLILSLVFFVLTIMSKETSVVLPFVLVLTHFYLKLAKRIETSIKTLFFSILPYFIILGIYLYLHFFSFGLVSGDSYIWNFAPIRAINTLSWYGVWSFNIPEMLIDFVGSGLRINPNLFKYWSKETMPIFALFAAEILIVIGSFIKIHKKNWLLLAFSFLWFTATLVPILFLPVHKFSFYLTLPLIGVVLALGYLLEEAWDRKVGIALFAIVWTIMSILALQLTSQTNWIMRSEVVSSKACQYFNVNGKRLSDKNIYFIDTKNDISLPWSPTEILKVALADKNFFDVFYPDLAAKINYAGIDRIPKSSSTEIIESRQFLGY